MRSPVGLVEVAISDAVVRSPLIDAGPSGAVLRVPGVAEYLIGPEGVVQTARAPDATDLDVSCFADGPALALALLYQGHFPLRAVAVSTRWGAVLLCGRSGSGKSVTAAALALSLGAHVIADGVVVVSREFEVIGYGAPGQVVLWPRAALALGLGEATYKPVRPSLAKRRVDLGGVAPGMAQRLRLIVALDTASQLEAPVVEDVGSGRQVLHALAGAQWHHWLVAPLGLGERHLEWASQLGAGITFARLRRPNRGQSIEQTASLVAARLEAAANPK
ncbi:MAG: hypothetical protein ACRD0Z_14765 [Acidimicrobiales bacterium]